jgi:hypothetical protein
MTTWTAQGGSSYVRPEPTKTVLERYGRLAAPALHEADQLTDLMRGSVLEPDIYQVIERGIVPVDEGRAREAIKAAAFLKVGLTRYSGGLAYLDRLSSVLESVYVRGGELYEKRRLLIEEGRGLRERTRDLSGVGVYSYPLFVTTGRTLLGLRVQGEGTPDYVGHGTEGEKPLLQRFYQSEEPQHVLATFSRVLSSFGRGELYVRDEATTWRKVDMRALDELAAILGLTPTL